MSSAPRTGALLLDVDGVLRHWPREPAERAERAAGLEPGTVSHAVFGEELLGPLMLGRISRNQWVAQASAKIERSYGRAGLTAFEAWLAIDAPFNAAMLELVRRVRQSIPVGLLTNTAADLRKDLRTHGLQDAFAPLVWSQEVGSSKPDPAIYREAVRRLHLPPGRVLFLDDSEGHVTAARRAGMEAELFVNVAMFRHRCEDSGLLGYP